MIIKMMTITNSLGESITFNREFKLIDDFDMSGLNATVNYSQTRSDGSHVQDTILENREFLIPFFIHRLIPDDDWFEEQRSRAYRVFNPKANPHRIDIITKGNNEYYINANLESTPIFPNGFENSNSLWQKGVLEYSTGDPYFYSKATTSIGIALWIPNFEFELEFPEEGIEVEYRSPSLIVNVFNEGQYSTGINIKFIALGSLSNPSLIDVTTYESLKVEIDMLPGDVIEISTYHRNKSAYLIRDNVRTDITNNLTLQSKYLQLQVGDNLFRYDADSQVDNLEAYISFTPRLLGV